MAITIPEIAKLDKNIVLKECPNGQNLMSIL